MATKIVIWDDQLNKLGSASSIGRAWIRDFFASPFWPNIPDKPFSTLSNEFKVVSSELQIDHVDFSKVTNRKISLIELDSSLIPVSDGTQDIGSASNTSLKRWSTLFVKNGVQVVDDQGNTRVGIYGNGEVHVGHDFKMARTGDGDFTWKRALVVFPDHLVINYDGDFTNGVTVGGTVFKPDTDNTVDLGSTTNKWKTLYLSNGLQIIDTQGNVRGEFKSNGELHVGHDLMMARTCDGDFTWKRALVVYPDHLVINYGGDFNNGVEVDGSGLFPPTDGIGDLGEPDRRWNAVHAVTVSTGDVVFKNGWRITECEDGKVIDGLRILDNEGNEILEITKDGLFFKGRRVA